MGGAGGVPTSAGAPRNDDGGAKSYSTTNNQIAGVDEADFLKNDGENIYILADGKLQIVDAWPPEQAHLVSATAIEGTPKKLFVHKSRALVYSSLDTLGQSGAGEYDSMGYGYAPKECTYGYDCDFSGDGRALKITVLDLSDLSAPTVLRETTMTGSYLNSRRIGDFAYTVVTFPEISIPGVTEWPAGMSDPWSWCWSETTKPTAEEIDAAFSSLSEANAAVIAASAITDYLPSVTDTRHVPGGDPIVESGLLADCKGFYAASTDDGGSLLSVVTERIDDLGPIDAATVVGRPGAVYASGDALYIAQRHYSWEMTQWFWDAPQEQDEATTVHKFAIDATAGTTVYAGSGVVKGHVLNQFAMDEYQGNLRIATTNGHVPDPNVTSALSVLAQGDGTLDLVGQIDGIAPTEDIRSVRFDGDRGFIVTFKKTDPLFVLDLADATAPVIRGELKIPGFSTYMHMMDDEHVLSIGYDADDQGSFAWFQGIQLQVMDVTDMGSPKLDHKEVIGSRGSSSDAATNHLAFNYFKEKNLLAIPMTICEGNDGGGSYGDLMTFNGLLVYRVTADGGFKKVGGVSHVAPETQGNAWGACSSWWTDGSSVVKRSIFMDGYVVSIADDQIKFSDLTDLAHPVASVKIAEPTWPTEPMGW